MKIKPSDMEFGIAYDVFEDYKAMHLSVFPLDENHPNHDRLDQDDLTLPVFLKDRNMDAENLWVFEVDEDRPDDETLKAEMIALGYKFSPKLCEL